MSRPTILFVFLALAVLLAPRPVAAICDVIPGAVQAKRSALGSADRPYATPGDYVEITPAPLFCTRVESFPLDPQAVTVVFDPPDGPNNAVVIANDCAALAAQLATCDTELGVGTVTCIDADDDMDPATGSGVPHLVQSAEAISFRFPDTDARVDGVNDDRTLSGPTRIAAVPAGASLQCGQLASNGCSDTEGMTACIDKFYELDGTCQTDKLAPTFPAFSSLPPPNDYSDMCEDAACVGGTPEVRFTIDTAGNALVPVDWRGLLVRVDDIPFPRLVDGSTSFPAFDGAPDPVRVPPSMIASFALNGIPVPPLFTPLAQDQDTNDPLALFGTVDAPLGVMRIARRSKTFQECSGGDAAGQPCNEDSDCPAGSCGPTTCVGGDNAGAACSSDAPCTGGGECGPALFAFDDRFSGEGCGPVLITAAEYDVGAGTTVQIDALIDTDDTLAFPVREAIENAELNADSDQFDTVVRVGNTEDGIGDPQSAVVVVRQAPFRFAAIASEGEIVAYPEPEANEGDCDNGLLTCDTTSDGDIGDTLLRALRVQSNSAVPVSASLGEPCLDPDPIVAGRSIVVSDRLIFVRADEPACADQLTESIGPLVGGSTVNEPSLSRHGDVLAMGETLGLFDRDVVATDRVANMQERLDVTGGDPDPLGTLTLDIEVDASGERVVFVSDAALVGGVPGGSRRVYVRNRATDTTVLASVTPGGAAGFGRFPRISHNGRFVVFRDGSLFLRDLDGGTTTEVVAPTDPFVLAECGILNCGLVEGVPSDDGSLVAWTLEIGDDEILNPIFPYVSDLATGTIESLEPFLGSAFFGPFRPWMDSSGRFVMTSTDDSLVAGDTNTALDVHVYDRVAGTVERVSVGTNGEESPAASWPHGLSADGRRVLFETSDALGGDPGIVPNDSNDANDVFVHDRLTGITERVSLTNGDAQTTGAIPIGAFPTSGLGSAGRATAYQLNATSLQVRTFDPTDVGADYNGDGDARDLVLAIVDTDEVDPELVGLGASGQADVAEGNAAFLLGGDADPAGGPVNLYRNRSGVSDLGLFASQVELSSEWVGALVSEAVEGNQNAGSGDADADDHVVHVNDVATGTNLTWVNVGQAADALDVAGSIAVFTTPEADQNGAVLNGDGMADDRVVQFFDADVGLPGGLVNLGVAAEDLVLGDFRRVCVEDVGGLCAVDGDCPGEALCHADGSCRDIASLCDVDADCGGGQTCEADLIFAFRASEEGQGENLNGAATNPDDPPAEADTDQVDDVLFAYDVLLERLVNSGQAMRTCQLQACDPRAPYRVVGETVRFLTFEGDQGSGSGQDLNNDGDSDDLLVQILSVRSKEITLIGALSATVDAPPGSDETPIDPLTPISDLGPGQGTNQVYVGRGLCVDSLAGSLQGTCTTDADCPADATCEDTVITVASADEDEDAIPDAIDNCLGLSNPGQADADQDGRGDLCDLQTCGNGIREFDENCDDGNLLDGDGCSAFCSAPQPPIELDIAPGKSPNVINIKKNGVIQVLVLGSEEIDVELIDPDTLAFGPDGAAPNDPGDPHIAHYNGNDGFKDAKIHFAVQELGLQAGDTEACLEGELDGIFFTACQEVVVFLGRRAMCGLGFELVLLLPLMVAMRRRRMI